MDNPFGFLNGLYLYGTCFHERGKKMNYDLIDDSNMNRYQKQLLAQAKTIQSQRKELQAEREKVALLRGAVDRIDLEFSQCYGMDNPEAFQNRRTKTYILELDEALEKLKAIQELK